MSQRGGSAALQCTIADIVGSVDAAVIVIAVVHSAVINRNRERKKKKKIRQ